MAHLFLFRCFWAVHDGLQLLPIRPAEAVARMSIGPADARLTFHASTLIILVAFPISSHLSQKYKRDIPDRNRHTKDYQAPVCCNV